MRNRILPSRPYSTVVGPERLRQTGLNDAENLLPGAHGMVFEPLWEIANIQVRAQPALMTKPMTPRMRPASAIPPPPSVPPLEATRWREMKPMIAAAGPIR